MKCVYCTVLYLYYTYCRLGLIDGTTLARAVRVVCATLRYAALPYLLTYILTYIPSLLFHPCKDENLKEPCFGSLVVL